MIFLSFTLRSGRRQCESYYLCHVCSRVCVVATSRSSFDVHRIVIRHDTIPLFIIVIDSQSISSFQQVNFGRHFGNGEYRELMRGVGIRSMPPISRTFGGRLWRQTASVRLVSLNRQRVDIVASWRFVCQQASRH
jgi:hypothetical protein